MEMTKYRNLYYKPKWFDEKWIDNGIDIYTRNVNLWLNPAGIKGFWLRRRLVNSLACSHAERWWPDEAGEFYGDESCPFAGETFTSTMGQTGGKNRTGDGTIIRPASETLKHPERWFYSEKNCPVEALEYVKERARDMVKYNEGYDRGDIWKLFDPRENKRKQDIYDNKLICSGACWWFDYMVGADWRFHYKNYEQSLLHKLVCNRTMDLLPSPLLLALWEWQAGFKFFDLATGKEMII